MDIPKFKAKYVVSKFTPHGIRCRDCQAIKRCNQCGEVNLSDTNKPCKNGRCPDCCSKICIHKIINQLISAKEI